MKKSFILIIILAVLIRLLYRAYFSGALVTADTHGYYFAGKQMLTTRIFVHDARPPTYPLILNLAMMAQNKFGAEIGSDSFAEGMNLVIFLQILSALVGLFILYRIVFHLKIPFLWSWLFTVFISFDIMLFISERALLTESFATFFLLIITFLLIKLLQKPKIPLFAITTFLFIAAMMLKPLYAGLPFVTVPIIMIYHRNLKRVLLYSLMMLSIVLVVLISYVQLNSRTYYPGFSLIGDIDLLGQILYFRLPVEAGRDFPYFYKNVLDYRKINGDPMPYRFLEYYDPQIWLRNDLIRQIKPFAYRVIAANLVPYISLSLKESPAALLATNDVFLVTPKPADQILNKIFQSIFYFYQLCQYATLIALPFYPVTVILFLKKPTIIVALLTIIGTIAVLQIVGTVLFVYYDFGRLISVVQPQLYLFSFFWWGKILEKTFLWIRHQLTN